MDKDTGQIAFSKNPDAHQEGKKSKPQDRPADLLKTGENEGGQQQEEEIRGWE